MKTKNIFFAFLMALSWASFTAEANAQAATDTSYMVEIDENGDSTCYLLIGDVKGEVDCKTALAYANAKPPVLDITGTDMQPGLPEAKEKPKVVDQIKTIFSWIVANIIILFGIAELVVRLTPSEKDNNILRLVQSWLDAIIPNIRKGGGKFVAFEDVENAPKLAVVKSKNLPTDSDE